MSAKQPKLLFPVLIALLLLAGGAFFLSQLGKEPRPEERAAAAEEVLPSPAVEPPGEARPAPATELTSAADESAPEEKEAARPEAPNTVPGLDPIFKQTAERQTLFSADQIAKIETAEKGEALHLNLGGVEVAGTLDVISESEFARSYAVDLTAPSGRLVINFDGNDEFSGFVVFKGESRALRLEALSQPVDEFDYRVEPITISDLICAPSGTTYPFSRPANAGDAGLAAAYAPKVTAPGVVAAAPALDSRPGSEFVFYLDFDGEEVVDDLLWPDVTALPHPRANDSDWITLVWKRVAEDFAPFNINVTTDRAVYDAADPDKRLHGIATPTDDVFPGAGGVAFQDSFRLNSPIVWVFNLSEYTCADTFSHEAGHAFGLDHDGQSGSPPVEYYGGHNDDYSPGWAPIMGAPWADPGPGTLYDEVSQWSRGEYLDANNQQDDLSIIGNASNGFGFRSDDVADSPVPPPGSGAAVGVIGIDASNRATASGIISTSEDVDVFRFGSNEGLVSLTVEPLDVESEQSEPGSETRGANLAVSLRLLDQFGDVVAFGTPSQEDSPGRGLSATVTANVPAGIYYLEVSGTGRGINGEVGFTDYASVGQYFISGNVAAPPLTVQGGDKTDEPVVNNDTETRRANGTDFGFTQPSAPPVVNTFLLGNSSSSAINNLSITVTPDSPFSVASPPPSTIPGESQTYIGLQYDPAGTGLHSAQVQISYTTGSGDTEFFNFTLEGTSTAKAQEDNYEENDNYNQAFDLSAFESTALSDLRGLGWMSDNGDFYRFRAGPNDRILEVFTSHDSSRGALSFSLHDSHGALVGVTSGDSGAEKITYIIPEGATIRDYYIWVRPTNPDVNPRNTYDLSWTATELISTGDDFYEENDFQSQAFDLSNTQTNRLSGILGTGIQNDEDWYEFEVPRDPFARILYVRLIPLSDTAGPESLELELHNDELGLVDVGFETDDGEFIDYFEIILTEDVAEEFSPDGNTVIFGPPEGTYYFRVTGDNSGVEYDLEFELLRDDRYEISNIDPEEENENDSQSTPYSLGTSILGRSLSELDGVGVIADYTNASSIENFTNLNDADWYEFEINPSGVEAIDVTFIGLGVSTDYLTYELRTEQGFLIDSYVPNIPLDLANVPVTLTIPRPNATKYLIKVTAASTIGFLTAYDFTVVVDSVPPLIEGAEEDNYEENDNYAEAFSLVDHEELWLSALDGMGALFDPDWYEIEIPVGATRLEVDLAFDATEGDMDLTLTNDRGLVAFESAGQGDSESIVWSDPNPGTYLIAVTGDETGNAYNLLWDIDRAEDGYEENDTRASAFSLAAYERVWLSKIDDFGVQADEDWYSVPVPDGAAELEVLTRFDPSAGDIDLEIYDDAGFLIARSVSSNSVETLTVPNPEGGTYFIRLYYGNAGNEYDLWWAAPSRAELDGITDDAYESNDVSNTQATNGPFPLPSDQIFLSEIAGPANQADDDWFEISVDEDNVGILVESTFSHAEGDVDLELYDNFGSVIARADSLTDDETIDYQAPLPEGTYLLRFYGANSGTEYDFYWVDRTEDEFEPNNTRQTAYSLIESRQEALSATDQATQGDEDWYRVRTTASGSQLVVDLFDFSHADGNIDLELYDASGTLIASSATDEDQEYLQVTVPSAGDYFIRVFGDDRYNDYDLFWNASEDDAFEENDSFADAADISGSEGEELAGVLFDDDWFVVTAPPGAVRLEVEFLFEHAAGDIDVEVFDSDGDPVTIADSTTDNETLTVPVAGDGDSLYFRVYGADGNLGNDYVFTWESSDVDSYEENDSFFEAFDISFLEGTYFSRVLGPATSKDEDWYLVNATGSNLLVECLFVHAEGNIDLEIRDADGDFVARSISTTDNESILLPISPGEYYIRVYGDLAGNRYDLYWRSFDDDDDSEENDDRASASTDIESAEYELTTDLVQFDQDWFSIVVEPGDERLLVDLFFEHVEGDLNLYLYDASDALVASSESGSDDESLDLSSLAPDTYYLLVDGPGFGTPYSLSWSSGAEDAYEENDSASTAFDLSSHEMTLLSSLSGPGAQYDEDWFRVDLTDPGANFIEIEMIPTEDDSGLTIEVLDADGEVLASDSPSDSSSALITLQDLVAGSYFFRITGNDYGRTYDLQWRGFPDDNYEQNDSLAGAYDFSDSPGVNLQTIDGPGIRVDEDYFRVVTRKNDVHLNVDCFFAHADGNIDIEILSATGESLATATSEDDNESIVLDLPTPAAAEYFIRVFGAENSGATYDLVWSSDSIDNYEDNESAATATDITGSEGVGLSTFGGHATQNDEDWYSVTLDPGDASLLVQLIHDRSFGDIDIEVLDSSLNVLGSSATDNDIEEVNLLLDRLGGTYYFRVFGDDTGSSYELIWATLSDDNYEENDSEATAYDITSQEGEPLSNDDGPGAQFDEDWYAFSTPAGAVAILIELTYQQDDGNLILELYDSTSTLMASSDDTSGVETIDVPVDPAGADYTVRVRGDDLGNLYDLTWIPRTEDNYEENDFISTAFDLSGSEGLWLDEVDGFATQFDDDWFQIVVSDGSVSLEVEIEFTHDDGDIDLELYQLVPTDPAEVEDPAEDQRKPVLVAREATTTDNEAILFPVSEPGIYYIRVYFGNTGNVYRLRWDDGIVDPEGDLAYLTEDWEFALDGPLAPALSASPTADSDGDGMPVWLEFALGSDDSKPTAVNLERHIDLVDGVAYFHFSFEQSKEAVRAGYEFVPQECADMNFEESVVEPIWVSTEDLGDGMERVTYRSAESVVDRPTGFFRLKVRPPAKSY